MKLIIEIPNNVYNMTMTGRHTHLLDRMYYAEAIKKGTPLKTELQKIEKEIDEQMLSRKAEIPYTGEYKSAYNEGLCRAYNVVDKHIEKLKGR